jgi:hypothetical protein
MAGDATEIVGTWTVKFMQWTWFYTFTADGRVTWRDPLNNKTGEGRWSLLPSLINLSWTGSTTKETWKRPVKPDDQEGWVSAEYGNGVVKAKKVAESAGPTFVKDPDTGTVGSWFTSAGQLWRQDVELGSSATIALKKYSGLTVGLNDPKIAKLVTWCYGEYLYVDVVPTAIGNANLEARSGDTVVASIQILVGTHIDGAVFVDDFAGSYYDLGYRRVGKDLSKWIVLEYKDSVLIDINIDSIFDASSSNPGSKDGYIGEGGRRFPSRMDPSTTPRLCAAKQRAIAVMTKDFADFLEVARDGIFFILTINPLVAPIQPGSVRPVNRSSLPRRVATHFDAPPEVPVFSGPKSYVNLNPAEVLEGNLGVWLDGEAQAGRLGTIKRVRGVPTQGTPGGNPDYHLFFSDVDNAELANLSTTPDLRGDAVIAEGNNIDNIITNNVSSKSGRQADVVIIEVGTRGESGTITDEAIRAWKIGDIRQQFPKLRRLIVVRNTGGVRRSVLDLEAR